MYVSEIYSNRYQQNKMPGTRCTVATCNNSLVKTGTQIIYHSFPKDENVRKIWIQRCKRGGKWNSKSCHVCSNHFGEDDYERDLKSELLGLPPKKKLKKTAVPNLNLIVNKNLEKSIDKQKRDNQREERLKRKTSKQLVATILNAEGSEQEVEKSVESEQNVETNFTNDFSNNNSTLPVNQGISYCHHLHDFEGQKDLMENRIKFLEQENSTLKRKCEEITLSRNQLMKKIKTLHSDLESSKILDKNELTVTKIMELMSPAFTRTQIEKLIFNKKKVLWKNEDICRAFTLRYLGKRSYLYLRNELKVPLPAISTLQRWASKLEIRNGLLKQVLQIMKIASTDLEKKEKYIVIMFDEVKIKSVYEYDKKTDRIVGRHNQMQVAMIRSLFAKLKQTIYLDFDQKMTKEILLYLITELYEASYTVIACVSDCGGGNMGLWKELGITIENTHFAHPITGDNVYVFADVPHLLKLIRNWFIDTGTFKPILNNYNIP